jgi:hypothetical protein
MICQLRQSPVACLFWIPARGKMRSGKSLRVDTTRRVIRGHWCSNTSDPLPFVLVRYDQLCPDPSFKIGPPIAEQLSSTKVSRPSALSFPCPQSRLTHAKVVAGFIHVIDCVFHLSPLTTCAHAVLLEPIKQKITRKEKVSIFARDFHSFLRIPVHSGKAFGNG